VNPKPGTQRLGGRRIDAAGPALSPRDLFGGVEVAGSIRRRSHRPRQDVAGAVASTGRSRKVEDIRPILRQRIGTSRNSAAQSLTAAEIIELPLRFLH
jgi:hypothetical protein